MPRIYTADDLRVGMLVQLSPGCSQYPGMWGKVMAVHPSTIDVWVGVAEGRHHDATVPIGHVIDSRDTHRIVHRDDRPTLPVPAHDGGRFGRQQRRLRGQYSPAAMRRDRNG